MEFSHIKARVDDCVSLCLKTDMPKFLGFLSQEEAAFAKQCLSGTNVRHEFFGGFDLAERTFLGIFPDWVEETYFPLVCVRFAYPDAYTLSHRDFLGALMSLKISRESVGDILTGKGIAAVFLSETVAAHVLSEITKVGSVGVKPELGMPDVLPRVSKKIILSDTIASDRLDCIIATVAGSSRSKAAEIINEGRVSVNSVLCQKTTKTVKEGDSITVRGKGRFTVESLSERSKKGRIIFTYGKFV